MALSISEIFFSIQGESLYSGRPCIFVRLSGCNLRCSYCDTRYAYAGGTHMKISEILDRVSEFGCSLVEITGGEPLFQQETPILISSLIERRYEVLLETNGSFDISRIDRRCIKIMDVKCPSSGESSNNDLENWKRLNPADQVKFVIANREDFEYAKKIMALKSDLTPWDHILFSPVYGAIEPVELAKWILDHNLQVRLHLQLHKIIWPDIDRGV